MTNKLLTCGWCQSITWLFWKLVSKGKSQASVCLHDATEEEFFFLELFQLINEDRIVELEYHHEGMGPGIEF